MTTETEFFQKAQQSEAAVIRADAVRERWRKDASSMRTCSTVLAIMLMLGGILSVLAGLGGNNVALIPVGVLELAFAAFLGMAGHCLASIVEQGSEK
jgi:fatty acid desaturase